MLGGTGGGAGPRTDRRRGPPAPRNDGSFYHCGNPLVESIALSVTLLGKGGAPSANSLPSAGAQVNLTKTGRLARIQHRREITGGSEIALLFKCYK